MPVPSSFGPVPARDRVLCALATSRRMLTVDDLVTAFLATQRRAIEAALAQLEAEGKARRFVLQDGVPRWAAAVAGVATGEKEHDTVRTYGGER